MWKLKANLYTGSKNRADCVYVTYFVLGISYPRAGEGWTTFLVLSFTCPWKHRRLKCRVSRLSSCAWKQPDKAINAELAITTLCDGKRKPFQNHALLISKGKDSSCFSVIHLAFFSSHPDGLDYFSLSAPPRLCSVTHQYMHTGSYSWVESSFLSAGTVEGDL